MKHYSVLVKIENSLEEVILTDTLSRYILRNGGLILAITKEDEDTLCVEFALQTIKPHDEIVEERVLSLLQYIVVGL